MSGLHAARQLSLASRRDPLLTEQPSSSGGPRPQNKIWRRLLSWLAVLLTIVGIASYWFWVYLQYTPLWLKMIMGYKVLLGPEAPWLQQLLAAASLVLAATAASTSELLIGVRPMGWVFRRFRPLRVRAIEFTWVDASVWLLVLGSVSYWFFYEMIPEMQEIFGPPSPPSYYSYSSSYSYESGNHSHNHTASDGYAYDAAEAAAAAPLDMTPAVEALRELSRQAGYVSMIPISLLGVPLARSSALWRLFGLSYEEAIAFHRWLGILALVLTSFHSVGYLVAWLQRGYHDTIQPGVYLLGGLNGWWTELFSERGIAGLNPFCAGDYCSGVSNLAGLIAWIAGLLIWLTSLECMRRARYLLFIQTHQLHFVFFGFTAAHWTFGLFYLIPPAVFYAADIVLRLKGSYACDTATARVHGTDIANKSAPPGMVTLVLPVPEALKEPPLAASACPHLMRSRVSHSAAANLSLPPLLATDAPHATTTCPHAATATLDDPPSGGALMEHDPWAGTTVYLRVRALSPLRAIGGWTHPFTVAGSVALPESERSKRIHGGVGASAPPRALLVHIAPERHWTLQLARNAFADGDGMDVHVPGVYQCGPLPAPPHLEHLADGVMAGKPLLLIGAGSGVTPAIALLRRLASRANMPPSARVRLVVVARSVALLEALDGIMLPTDANGSTGLKWLTTELHLTRRVGGEQGGGSRVRDAPPAGTTTHSFRGGFRLSVAREGGGDALTAVSAPYTIAATATRPATGSNMPQHSRNVAADEICTLLGAFGGFVGVAWPLLCSTSYDAPLEGKPTAISGLAALLRVVWRLGGRDRRARACGRPRVLRVPRLKRPQPAPHPRRPAGLGDPEHQRAVSNL